MATMDSPKNESDTELETNSNPNPSSSETLVPTPNGPAVCLLRFAGDSIGGAFMGSIFGYGPPSLSVFVVYFGSIFLLIIIYLGSGFVFSFGFARADIYWICDA